MSSARKKIAIVTATRAEYGLLSGLIAAVDRNPKLELQLFVTGAHLSQEQGMTVQQIEADGWPIAEKIPILPESEAPVLSQAEAVSKAVSGFSHAFQTWQPDCVVVLGDRYELLGICSAALLNHVPIAHLHGGEVTEGAMDEAIRHAVTKLAHWHFVAAEPYRRRVIQMGEQPGSVFNVGAPGLDVIQKNAFLSKGALSNSLEMPLDAPIFLVTYHPVSWDETSGVTVLENLFKAIERFPNASVVWTAANTDASGATLNQAVQRWIKETTLNAKFFTSLGSQRYLSLMREADVVLGNSSSGIIEAPAIGTPTVNIGERQAGRLRALSIIDTDETVEGIVTGVEKALSSTMQATAATKPSCYGQGDTAEQISLLLAKLLNQPFRLAKSFYDLEGV
jgi:UDP-N-acetylglucosamine 2-epimerase (non-hydrolysing)/GDP/UDP-N,N'-diacetylbacillosamine 2-epimerase (hydrolysing)